jgi:archaeal preflagellin peptidase FlaK
MLAIASILDIKSREIPDKVWLAFGGIGLVITLLALTDPLAQPVIADKISYIAHYALGVGLVAVIGYAVYKAGLFGGADPKALVAIALTLPTLESGYRLYDFPALTSLTNALLISLSGMFYNIARNSISVARGIPIFEGMAESSARKALAFAVGFSSSSTSSGNYLFAMEERDDSGQRKFVFNPAQYDEFTQNSGKRMWMTQALPFIVYIAIGFAVTLVMGDLIGLIFSVLL